MFAKILKRAIILLAVYAFLIIGIFIIQFKNDSIISEKVGNLHITLLESVSDDNSTSLKNKFTVSYSGLSLLGGNDLPVVLKTGDTEQTLSLVSWEKDSDFSFFLRFSHGIDLHFSVSDDTPQALLNINANLPIAGAQLLLPYMLSSGSEVIHLSDSKIQIQSKNKSWELSSVDNDNNYLVLSSSAPVASYVYVDKTREYSFAMSSDIEFSTEHSYRQLLENLRQSIVTAFNQSVSESANISEQEVVSYVAVMAEMGKYGEAIDAVPQSFRRSSSRTYLSAPYFNDLVQLNESLKNQMKAYEDAINNGVNTDSYDVFCVRNLADYMCINAHSQGVQTLLTKTGSADLSAVTVFQATGILSVYASLYEKNKNLASLLQGALHYCVDKIEKSCTLTDKQITVSEKDALLSVVSASQVGDAILRYGRITKNSDYESAGRLILNSYLRNTSSFSLRTLCDVYQYVVHTNTFYPHYEILETNNGKTVWAWTCTSNIGYQDDKKGTIHISIDFPASQTHYVILNGIGQFKTIYIYDMAFRTDPRFETYNSSGYVYQAATETLLLKSRHRSKVERIRLVNTERAAATTTEIHESVVQ
ncbi:MAG: hypothetical protein K2M50_10550 [Treponemataceae bacterium]|nr:hypothetical protein [Treponemataceae bacterium]